MHLVSDEVIWSKQTQSLHAVSEVKLGKTIPHLLGARLEFLTTCGVKNIVPRQTIS